MTPAVEAALLKLADRMRKGIEPFDAERIFWNVLEVAGDGPMEPTWRHVMAHARPGEARVCVDCGAIFWRRDGSR